MFNNYLKTALRNLLSHKTYAVINITGLAIGLATSYMILIYVLYEFSYDKFNENYENIFRIATKANISGKDHNTTSTMATLVPFLSQNCNEIEYSTRIKSNHRLTVTYEKKLFFEDKILYVDADFGKIFSLKFIKGNDSTALSQPYNVVITQEIAKKYFKYTNPVGKVISIDNHDYTISAIVKDFPENSHIKFNFLIPFSTLYTQHHTDKLNDWIRLSYKTYIRLKSGVNPEIIESELDKIVERNVSQKAHELNIEMKLFLQPLADIHLYSKLNNEFEKGGDLIRIYAYIAIAILILFVASINFMNLTTARSTNRVKEIGVRKIYGANTRKIKIQFLSESIIMSFIGLSLALLLIETTLPVFNRLTGKELSILFLFDWKIILIIILLTLSVGLIAGSYPAFFLSSIQPALFLKGTIKASKKSQIFRNTLVAFQFIVALILICSTLIIFRQLSFMENTELGYKKDKILIVRLNDSLRKNWQKIKSEIDRIHGVISVSGGSGYPGGHVGRRLCLLPSGKTDSVAEAIPSYHIDEDFIRTLGMEMKAGRNFMNIRDEMSSSVIINETLSELLDITYPLGKQLSLPDPPLDIPVKYNIVGIVKDFHQSSFHQKIEPILLFPPQKVKTLLIRITSTNQRHILHAIESTIKEYEPTGQFEFSFFENELEKFYVGEQNLAKTLLYFTFVAVLIACMGLFGLAAFTTEKRTKEIAVRKSMGSNIPEIIALLSGNSLKLVIISTLLAFPLTYIVMQQWLESFAYRIRITFSIFASSAIIILLIVFFTTLYQCFRAAKQNPVNTLRYE